MMTTFIVISLVNVFSFFIRHSNDGDNPCRTNEEQKIKSQPRFPNPGRTIFNFISSLNVTHILSLFPNSRVPRRRRRRRLKGNGVKKHIPLYIRTQLVIFHIAFLSHHVYLVLLMLIVVLLA